VSLASQRGAGEIFVDEDRADSSAELLDGVVGGVLRAAAGEAPQDLLRFGGAEIQRGGVLDDRVVLLRDQLPFSRAYRHTPTVCAQPPRCATFGATGKRVIERLA